MAKASESRTIGLLLINDFALMSYASIVEPFRAANTLTGQPLYRWVHISTDGKPVRASNGAMILADQSVSQPLQCEMLFVFAAGDPTAFQEARTFAWLRRQALKNTVLVGVSGGPFLLARAGLLEGHSVTIHWDHRPTFVEMFPTLHVESSLYVIDRRRVTCAGGIAGLDLAIELIEREQGNALANKVSEWFIRAEPRPANEPQRLSLRERYGVSDDRVLKVLARMEATVEEPISRVKLAKIAGVSVRSLERLFIKHSARTLNEAYLQIRLNQAHQLVHKTNMTMTNIALACGFQSSSHFSRAFKDRFGSAPSRARGA
ncbi:GlxA family transcriptional regulator [Bradyrhizobium canariense]|uniref:Transcriptional regulator, AraC family with amidase-like domain n=1 Tax=Bradyrhizobium canariense TaxID=255045 RepID=A0A1H1NFK6_9BRAD|nr:GlxA family transcriptional regulator [Bradyrhizobium canariense]SDR97595.1 transcriptional regulator, AraC family with amidase-like domain [Bradyrhizobium canariense]